MTEHSICITFDDNRLLAQLFGEDDHTLAKIESAFNVTTSSRGNMISLKGDDAGLNLSQTALKRIYKKLEEDSDITDSDVDAIIRILIESSTETNNHNINGEKPIVNHADSAVLDKEFNTLEQVSIKTLKKRITPYSRIQAEYMKQLLHNDVVFGSGPAGTGKTYLAVAAAVSLFLENKVERIILSRPAVEAGERLGFLPGDMKEKVDPYLRPLYDALYDMLPAEKVVRYMQTGEIEIAPLAYMRGRTLSRAFVILDEAQNTTPVQMKMFLTRLGEGTHMAITGDLSQTDLPKGQRSGFRDAMETLETVDEIAVTRFQNKDVVRHPLTVKIVAAYERFENDEKWKRKPAQPNE